MKPRPFEAWTDEEVEADRLQASPIACAVADAWLSERSDFRVVRRMTDESSSAFDALELATRESPLRKVKPYLHGRLSTPLQFLRRIVPVLRKCPRWQLQHSDGSPYLTRTVLAGVDSLENHDPECKIHAFIHQIHTRDSDAAQHSHPWRWSVSVILSGGYTEVRPNAGGVATYTYREGDLNILRHGDYHSIVEVLPGTVTLFLGGAEISGWGFLCDGVHVPHKEYFKQHGGEAMRTVRL